MAVKIKHDREKRKLNPLGVFLTRGIAGDVFYTDKALKHVTALTTYYKVKASTEIVLAISNYGTVPETTRITKVTLL
jgi:hypothetical protein